MRGLPHVLTLFARKAPSGQGPRLPTSSTRRTSCASSATAARRRRRMRRRCCSCPRSSTGTTCSISCRRRASPSGSLARGFDVYCIDWGTPGDEDRYLTFDEICDGYLGRAVRTRRQGRDERGKRAGREGSPPRVLHGGDPRVDLHGGAAGARRVARDARGPRALRRERAARGVDPVADVRRAGARGGVRERAVAADAERVSHAAAHAHAGQARPPPRPRMGRRVARRISRAGDVGERQRRAPGRGVPELHRGSLPAGQARTRRAHPFRASGTARGDHLPDPGDHVRARQHRPVEEREGARRSRLVEGQGVAAFAGRTHRRRGVEERVEATVAEDRGVVVGARRGSQSRTGSDGTRRSASGALTPQPLSRKGRGVGRRAVSSGGS